MERPLVLFLRVDVPQLGAVTMEQSFFFKVLELVADAMKGFGVGLFAHACNPGDLYSAG